MEGLWQVLNLMETETPQIQKPGRERKKCLLLITAIQNKKEQSGTPKMYSHIAFTLSASCTSKIILHPHVKYLTNISQTLH